MRLAKIWYCGDFLDCFDFLDPHHKIARRPQQQRQTGWNSTLNIIDFSWIELEYSLLDLTLVFN